MAAIGSGFTLLLGGARSGKSDLAVRLGESWDGDVIVAATAEASDGDMARRIHRHQNERPTTWGLIEAPLLSAHEIVDLDAEALVIIDCITLLVSNLLYAEKTESEIYEHGSALTHALAARTAPTIVVTNEVGLGVHPTSELGRQYRDLLGRYNRRLAEGAETALFVVAGRVTPLETLVTNW